MTVIVRPKAADDLRTAHAYYAEIDAGLSAAFGAELDQVVDRLVMFPRSGVVVEQIGRVRRARMRRFPYGVFYRLADPDEVRILRVLHSRRNSDVALSDDE